MINYEIIITDIDESVNKNEEQNIVQLVGVDAYGDITELECLNTKETVEEIEENKERYCSILLSKIGEKMTI